MHKVSIHLDGDGCWPDLNGTGFAHGELKSVAYLNEGTVEGSPTVSFRIQLDNGETVIAETTLRMYMSIAAAFHGQAEREGFTDLWSGPATGWKGGA